jgi:hypothetical protein
VHEKRHHLGHPDAPVRVLFWGEFKEATTQGGRDGRRDLGDLLRSERQDLDRMTIPRARDFYRKSRGVAGRGSMAEHDVQGAAPQGAARGCRHLINDGLADEVVTEAQTIAKVDDQATCDGLAQRADKDRRRLLQQLRELVRCERPAEYGSNQRCLPSGSREPRQLIADGLKEPSRDARTHQAGCPLHHQDAPFVPQTTQQLNQPQRLALDATDQFAQPVIGLGSQQVTGNVFHAAGVKAVEGESVGYRRAKTGQCEMRGAGRSPERATRIQTIGCDASRRGRVVSADSVAASAH